MFLDNELNIFDLDQIYAKFYFRLLKYASGGPVDPLSTAGIKPMTSPSGPVSNSPSPVITGQFIPPSSTPGNPPLTSPSITGGISASSLEMLLVERAKALQQVNPVAKAFADLQGN